MKFNQKIYPSVTFVVLAYNQEDYIEKAVNSALAQDYPCLKIIISDDFSEDETFNLAEKVVGQYSGSYSVNIRKNNSNLGLIEHVNRVMSAVDTELVFMAGGDDISLPNRVSTLVNAYISHGKPNLLSSKAFKIDKAGKILDGLSPDRVVSIENLDSIIDSLNSVDSRVGLYLGATGAWSMELWRKYGPIQHANCWEDVVMGFRAALEGSYNFIDVPLVQYRINLGLSSQSANSLVGKIALRKSKVSLKRDLARQRYDDLFLSPKKDDVALIAKVSRQALLHSIRRAYYESANSVGKYFMEYPALTIMQGISEMGFLSKVIARAGLKFIKS